MNAAEIIKKDLDAIYIGNLSTVDDNLTLPENGKYGAQFTWETGEERFIDNTGKVHRPLHGMGNRKVTLTVTATYEGYSESREYVATVLQEAKENIVKEVRKVVLNALVGEEAHLPSVVIVYTEDGRRMTMPVKWNTYEPAKEETVVAVAGVIDGTEKEASAEIHYKKEIVPVKGPEKKVGYFPLGQVRLKEGTLYYKYQKLMEEYLLGIDDDQMLYNFRKATGLDTKGAPPMTGWDEESCKLKGHTTGHYLSGIALAFAATGNPKFLDKVNYMVAELKKCQDAFAATGKYHRGFLSAYSEEQFDLLEVYTKYPEIWAPYYTLDKIMSGLYDCHVLAGNETAKEILDLMGDWVYDRLSRLPKETLDKMWAMYIAGEFGGMLGLRVNDLVGQEGITKKDLIPFTYPTDEELKRVGVTGIFLGYYIPWEGLHNVLVAKAHGFESWGKVVEGDYDDYENLDNYQAGIHEYFKYLKFGFGRCSDQASMHIRRGRISREEAMKTVKERDGAFRWTYLDKKLEDILEPIGVTVDEFIKICDEFTNKKLFLTDKNGKLIKDKNGNLTKINYDNVEEDENK